MQIGLKVITPDGKGVVVFYDKANDQYPRDAVQIYLNDSKSYQWYDLSAVSIIH